MIIRYLDPYGPYGRLNSLEIPELETPNAPASVPKP